MIVYLNGRFLPREEAKISPEDRGFLFADAIYEVVRYGAGRPYRLAEHLARMREGLTALSISVEPSFFPESRAHSTGAMRFAIESVTGPDEWLRATGELASKEPSSAPVRLERVSGPVVFGAAGAGSAARSS